MPVLVAKRLPDDFRSLLELFPAPFVIWQLLDRTKWETMIILEMNSIAFQMMHFTGDCFGALHKNVFPLAPQPVREGKIKTCCEGIPFNFVIHYSDNNMEEADYEAQLFRVHPEYRIICEFFCRKDIQLSLEGFNTVQFCKAAISFILNQTSTELLYLNVIIANILGHIENYSKNISHDKSKLEDFDVMDFNTMIRRLALGDEQNVEYVDIFLRSFPFVGLDSEYILYRLILRYIVAGSKNYYLENESSTNTPHSRMIVQLRVINVLKRWLTRYSYYFIKNRNLVKILESFINYTRLVEEMDPASINLQNTWRSSLESSLEEVSRQRRLTVDPQIYASPASPTLSKTFRSQRPSYHDPNYNPNPTSLHLLIVSRNQTPEQFAKSLAKHLTHQALFVFKSIELLELHAKLHTKGPQSLLDSPNVSALIENSNRVSKWVATEICREPDLVYRSELVQVFIEAAYAALSWNDFETCFSISAGLCVHPVDRLSTTWSKLFQRKNTLHKIFRRSTSKGKLTDLEIKWLHVRKVVNVSKNYSEYRSRISEVLRAATVHQGIKAGIPAYQVLSKDLMFLDENVNKKKSDNDIENYSQVPQIADINFYLSDSLSSLSQFTTDDSDFTFDSAQESGSSFDSSSDSGSLDSSRENSCSFDNMNRQSLLDCLSDFQKTDSINYFKLNQIATALNYVEHFKNSTYDFCSDPGIKNYFQMAHVADEDELYQLSYKINPPNSNGSVE